MLTKSFLTQIWRNYSTKLKLKDREKVRSWSIHAYGDLNELQLGENRIPIINHPLDVLVEVKAASVNPIDSFMLAGYGSTSFQVLRNFELEFPLVLGRDFSGTVIAKGQCVGDQLQVGTEVYGFIPIHKQGSFSEIICASSCHVLPKPKSLTDEESASLVYATMTAWSALFLTGNLLLTPNKKGLRVLVLGGSGGVGTSAIQLLKSLDCIVLSTCSTDAVPLVNSLGADLVFDRCDPEFEKSVCQEGKYHLILDAANVGINNIPNSWDYETYITLNSPLLVNNDKHGLLIGLANSAISLFQSNISRHGKTVKWGFFVPSNSGFQYINDLILKEKIKPVIHKVFNFDNLPTAVQTLREGHARGKIVIKYQ